MALDFLQQRYASRAPALDGVQIRQEELLATHHLLGNGLSGVAEGIE
jgi:hypothetical protein